MLASQESSRPFHNLEGEKEQELWCSDQVEELVEVQYPLSGLGKALSREKVGTLEEPWETV